MKTKPNVKPLRAWAILQPNGKLKKVPAAAWALQIGMLELYPTKKCAYDQTLIGQEPIQVLITPIATKRKVKP
jgi:hypothetical protein